MTRNLRCNAICPGTIESPSLRGRIAAQVPLPLAPDETAASLNARCYEAGYQAFVALLREGRARDRAAGRTLIGPQASDLVVLHGPKQAEAERCSTGEQKALLVGLVLAHARLVAAMTGMVESVTFRTDRMRALAESGFATATDLADWLVREAGLPFREAHHVTGRAVKRAEELGLSLGAVPLSEFQAIHPGIDDRVYSVLTVDASVASRMSHGGTAPAQVRARIAEAKGRME